MNHSINLVEVILNSTIIAGSFSILFFPLSKKRIRTHWANCVLVATGLIGIAVHVAQLMSEIQWFMLNGFGEDEFRFINGICVGLLFALIFSGQLSGVKRQEQTPANF